MSVKTSLKINVDKKCEQLITALNEQYKFDETSTSYVLDIEKGVISFEEAYCFSQDDFPQLFETIALVVNPVSYSAESSIELSSDGSMQNYEATFEKGKLSIKISDFYSIEYIDGVEYQDFCDEYDIDKKQFTKKTFNKLKKQGEVFVVQDGTVVENVPYVEEQTCKVLSTGKIQKRECKSLVLETKDNVYNDKYTHNGDFGYIYSVDSKKELTIHTIDNDRFCENLEIPETIDGLKVTGLWCNSKTGERFFYKKMTISRYLTNIFIPNLKVNSFYVDEKNEKYATDGYALYTKDMKTLLYMNNDEVEEYVIPDGVEKVYDFGRVYEMRIKRLVIPESVTEFSGGFQCPYLESVEGDIEKIKRGAYFSCLKGLENTPFGRNHMR